MINPQFEIIDQLQEPDRFLAHCLRVWVKDENTTLAELLSEACIGVLGELGEFLREQVQLPGRHENMIDEAGDVMYYITILRYLLNLDFTIKITEPALSRFETLMSASRFAESMKKLTFYDKENKLPTISFHLQNIVNYIIFSTSGAQDMDHFFEKVVNGNVKKLQDKWPNL